jgi:hypothetical protein
MIKDYGCAGMFAQCGANILLSFLPSGPSSADQLPVAIVLNCERRKGSPSTMIPSTFRLCLTAFLALLCATQAASKSIATGEHHNQHPRPPPTKHCTVQHNHNGADDSANILKAFKDCATDSVITFLPTNYSAFTPITLAGLSTFSPSSTHSDLDKSRQRRDPFKRKPATAEQHNKNSAGNERHDEPA